MSCLPNQEPEYWDNMLTPIQHTNGEIIQILCVSRNVTQQYLTENRLRDISERDELTGLFNRRSFKLQLKTHPSLLKRNPNQCRATFN